MIYVVHRTWRDNIFNGLAGSIAQLYDSKQGQSHNLGNGYFIKSGTWVEGTGCTFTTGQGGKVPYGPFTKEHFLTVQAHELGHYLFGLGHQNYGIMMGNWYPGYLATGIDARLSPWETIYLGYGIPTVVNFDIEPYQVNYHLNDFSSRNAGALLQVLQIPVNNNPEEFFLIANRSKTSTYDRVMAGDTAKDNFFRNNINPDYGKGIYIYHKQGGYTWPENDPLRSIDQECADGLFDWELEEFFNPDWSNTQQLAFLRKTGISRINDQSYGSLYNADEKSVFLSYQNDYYNCWGGIGKKHSCLEINNSCNESTDRIYTNNEEIWTSRAWKGDKWDSWRKGYNEIFSPYSSPSTIKWSGGDPDIFVWIYNQDNNGVDIKIYKTGYGGYNLSSILEETPPSRPIGLKTSYFFENATTCHPKITWEHNIEPDMTRNDGTKRYKIYRALSDNMNLLPVNYYIKAVVNINANSPAEYIDEQIIGIGSVLGGDGEYEPYPLRYKVVAVDTFEDESVPSDFTTATGLKPTGSSIDPGNNDNPILKSEIPKEFNLSQNYPNPFNPVTRINCALPVQGFVTLKIYDISGREIKELVNEFKQPGYYSVDFNGSNLASGVYFYRIKSGDFISVKKMVLIK